MPDYQIRKAKNASAPDPRAPEWWVIDTRYDDTPDDAYIIARYASPEAAEAEVKHLATAES